MKSSQLSSRDKSNRANTTAQRKQVSGGAFINNRPQAVVQRKLQEMADTKGVIQARGAKNGLPDDLKAGIESLSGISLDGVKVHYNSSKPAKMGALAYAQGNDIYLAPGQERHLAHEAWHVVQQKQGRVRPTTQLEDGVTINDNIHLEQEADRMGQRSSQAATGDGLIRVGQHITNSQGLFSPSDLTAQLKPKVFSKGASSPKVAKMADDLEKCVLTAKGIVDSNPMLTGVSGRTSGYLNSWVQAFTEFTDTGIAPQFFYARYGYAIETIATSLFRNTPLPSGYTVHTQIAHGTTRPDFVFRKGGVDCGWVDITSSASAGHINKKQGGKWKTCGYVAEILYTMPQPADFASSAKEKLTKTQIEALENANAAAVERAQNLTVGMDFLSVELANAYLGARKKKGMGLSKAELKQITINVCRKYLNGFNDDANITSSQAGNVLTAIEALEVDEDEYGEPRVSTGRSWATYAFSSQASLSAKNGQELIEALGAALRNEEESAESMDEDEDEMNT